MKQLILMIGLIVLLGANADAFAGGVFKCAGADGAMTFSFQPCPHVSVVVLESDLEAVEEQPEEPSQVETLEQLDIDIASLQQQLDDTKKDYRVLLTQSAGNRTDELTADFDETTTSLLNELNELQRERMRVAQL